MYICLCKGLTESDLRRATPCGNADPNALIEVLGLEDEDCCGRCLENIHELAALVSEQCAQCPRSHAPSDRLDTHSRILQ